MTDEVIGLAAFENKLQAANSNGKHGDRGKINFRFNPVFIFLFIRFLNEIESQQRRSKTKGYINIENQWP